MPGAEAEPPRRSEANALNLRAVFGFNKDIQAGVHDLTDVNRQAVLCVSAHTGIIYDYENRTQLLLQGHCNAISATCVSADKKFIVTADKGEDSMVIVWNAKNGVPIRSIFNAHSHGVAAIDMTGDAMFIATLSNPPNAGDAQELSVWEWAVDSEKPRATASVASADVQTMVRFNPTNASQLVSNGMNRVIFWSTQGDTIKYYSPPISKRDFKQAVGMFTQSLFMPDSTQAASATVDGDVVLWDQALLPEQSMKVTDKRAVKIVRLHKKAIRFITTFGKFFITGGDDGFVRFFDFKFRSLAWYEDLMSGAIISISFTSFLRPEVDDSEAMRVPNFVVGTANSLVLLVNASVFELLDEEQRRGEVIIQGQDSAVNSIAMHPSAPKFALVSQSGSVQIWDYELQALLVFAKYDKLAATHCVFDPKAELLGVGFANGGVKILNAETLQELHNFKWNKSAITEVAFSSDCEYFATADADYCVAIYRYELKQPAHADDPDEMGQPTEEWVYLGRIRSHSKPICSLMFGKFPDGSVQLRSVGEDRRVVEYDLPSSFVSTGIVTKFHAMVDHVSYPTACCLVPPLAPEMQERLVTSNDFYKFKTFDFSSKNGLQDHADTANCFRTLLGPTYGGPATRMVPLTNAGQQYLAYGTAEKVVGLVKMPLDGNPNKTMALIAHPAEISSIGVSYDGQFLLTAGGSDYTVNLWAIQPTALEAAAVLGGEGLTPYLNLIEGGQNGEFYNEITDFFYYAQLRSQGEDSTEERQVTGEVPLELVPDLMRALGYYPSKHQVDDLLFEMRYLRYEETGETNSHINLADFTLVYVNHRPVYGLTQPQIDDAFTALGAEDIAGMMDIHQLIGNLKRFGEAFTDQELALVLENLIGDSDLRHKLGRNELSARDFAELVLGFDAGSAGAAASSATGALAAANLDDEDEGAAEQ